MYNEDEKVKENHKRKFQWHANLDHCQGICAQGEKEEEQNHQINNENTIMISISSLSLSKCNTITRGEQKNPIKILINARLIYSHNLCSQDSDLNYQTNLVQAISRAWVVCMFILDQ